VEEVIIKLAAQGEKKVLIIPVGFVADHLETLYDLDIELKKLAEKEGIDFRRIPALNNDSGFIKLLGELVLANIDISCAE
jgi:ferrochelatase